MRGPFTSPPYPSQPETAAEKRYGGEHETEAARGAGHGERKRRESKR